MAAEYIVSNGNSQVILCERGIRTFEKATRSTLDLSAVPVIKRNSHLPVIVDPSHAASRQRAAVARPSRASRGRSPVSNGRAPRPALRPPDDAS